MTRTMPRKRACSSGCSPAVAWHRTARRWQTCWRITAAIANWQRKWRGHSPAAIARSFANCTLQLVELLRRHIRTENELVFNVAERLLTAADDVDAVQAFGRVVLDRDGAMIRQRHLAAIECWRRALEGGKPPGA
jgi:hemerythrin-like domain-containing protein